VKNDENVIEKVEEERQKNEEMRVRGKAVKEENGYGGGRVMRRSISDSIGLADIAFKIFLTTKKHCSKNEFG